VRRPTLRAERLSGKQVQPIASQRHDVAGQLPLDLLGNRHGRDDVAVARGQDVRNLVGRRAGPPVLEGAEFPVAEPADQVALDAFNLHQTRRPNHGN